jgi:hypothetical protein
MTLNHRCLLRSGFTILSVVVLLGTANAASSTRSSAVTQDRAHRSHVLHRQPLYNYYNYQTAPAVRPGCYLPSDGCLSEFSVQN